jgi:hypothetical protein
MLRIWFRFSLLLIVIWLLPLLLLSAQPADDQTARALLPPPEQCLAPCFMGIRPGETTDAEALAILEQHQWVGEIDYQYYDPRRSGRNLISWAWSGLQPELIDARRVGSIEFLDWEGTGVQKVDVMSIATTLTFGEWLLMAGPPSSSWFVYDASSLSRNLNVHTAAFEQRAVQVNTRVQCPLSIHNLAYQPIFLLSFGRPQGYRFSIGRPSDYFSRYFLRGPFPRYSAHELKRFPGC